MNVRVLMEALRVGVVSEEGIEAVESSGRGIVISLSQVLLADLRIELFAAVEEFSQGLRRIETNRITVSIVSVQLNHRTGKVGQNPSAAVTVKGEVEFLFRPVFNGYLADSLMSDNVLLCSLRPISQTIARERFINPSFQRAYFGYKPSWIDFQGYFVALTEKPGGSRFG